MSQAHAVSNNDATNQSEPAATPADTQPPQMSVAEILTRLNAPAEQGLPVEAIREVQRRRDEMIPHLIEVVDSVADWDERQSEEPENGLALLLAIFLLTEFEAKQAAPVLLRFLHSEDERVENWLGDAVTENLSNILAVLVDDDEQIERLINDPKAYIWVRSSAAKVFVYRVQQRRMTRQEAIDRLLRLMRAAIEREDGLLGELLACDLLDLGAIEAKPDMDRGFESDLFIEGMISPEHVDRELSDPDAAFERHMRQLEPAGVEDTVAELETWWCYRKDDRSASSDPSEVDEVDDEFRRLWDQANEQSLLNDVVGMNDEHFPAPETIFRDAPRVGRNDPCPCNSGKKYKKCCGRS